MPTPNSQGSRLQVRSTRQKIKQPEFWGLKFMASKMNAEGQFDQTPYLFCKLAVKMSMRYILLPPTEDTSVIRQNLPSAKLNTRR
jgi:hypothetical protein